MDIGILNLKPMKESLILISIGLLDLVITLALLGTNGAREGNPLMAYYLQFGFGAFVMVKLMLLFLPVFVAEWSKIYNPKFTKLMMRGAIAAYIGSYIILFLLVNIAPRLSSSCAACAPGGVRVAQHVK